MSARSHITSFILKKKTGTISSTRLSSSIIIQRNENKSSSDQKEKMIQGVWSRPSPYLSFPPIPSSSIYSFCIRRRNHSSSISATLESLEGEQLTARERRQLRNERRESKTTNWREEVEEKLLEKKPKKKYASWKEELNLDNLSLVGPQWWIIRVSRVSGQETAERLARSLARNYPDIDFKVYAPAIKVKRKLKNGTISVKPKPLVPGCVFLRCVLNKEIHDFIRECAGVGGFIGSKVGNTKRQINRPKPVSSKDMETVFQQAKEEQEKTDRTFEEEQQKATVENKELDSNLYPDSKDVTKSVTYVKQKRRSKKGKETLVITNASTGENDKFPTPGSSIRVVSGPFTEFTGSLRKLDHKTGKATVGFTLFGKESLVNLDVNQIIAETS